MKRDNYMLMGFIILFFIKYKYYCDQIKLDLKAGNLMPWIEAKYIYIYILLENVKGKYQE
jgi:hypothetical protein